MNSYFKPILNNIQTVEDADTLSSQIDIILENIYKTTNISISKLIDQTLSSETVVEIKKVFLEHALSFEHHEEIKSFFTSLKEELSKCKIMTLTLAYHPTPEHIKQLKNWCIQNLNDQIIFEFQFETELVAGTIVIFNGHYLDFSVKSKLTQYFSKQ